MTQHQHHSENEPWQHLPEGFADYLDLEARLNAPLRNTALDLAAHALDVDPAHIVDLGSGTGADAIALATRFPTSQIHALDISTELLSRVESAATAAGVKDQVLPLKADLNGDWSATIPGGVDLVWAALSLHHVEDPAQVLRQVLSALRPGGIFVLTEKSETKELQPGAHPDPHIQDWRTLLEDAGFKSMHQKDTEFFVTSDTADGQQYLSKQRQAHGHATEETAFRSARSIWVAKRPEGGVEKLRDVAIIGGGASGLAASIALARSRRDVVVIDDGHPRNAPADAAHNVLGNEGIAPGELLAKGRAEADSYGVSFMNQRVAQLSGEIDDFVITLDDGSTVHARRVILATGLIDDLPDVPGVQEGWGKTVLHCAFCHGWEVRDKRVAILARDEIPVHHALLFKQLSDQVTMFQHEASDPSEEQTEQLKTLGVELVRTRVERLVMDGRQVKAVQLADGARVEVDAVVVVPRFNARTDLYEALGGTAEQTPFGWTIPINAQGLTPLPGVWASGNASQQMAMVVAAASSGVGTGAAVHGDLAFADLNKAVLARRS